MHANALIDKQYYAIFSSTPTKQNSNCNRIKNQLKLNTLGTTAYLNTGCLQKTGVNLFIFKAVERKPYYHFSKICYDLINYIRFSN